MTGNGTRRKPPWPVWLLVALTFVVLVAVVGYFLVLPLVLFGPPKVSVHNNTAKTLSDVEVSVGASGDPARVRRLDRLKPNGTCSVRAEAVVVHIRVRFVLDGQTHVHETDTDLWRGETYSLHIEADGSVSS